MSTFSALNGALTSLIAQRQALEIAGQNIANVNTPGYTRQRANLQAIEGTAPASMIGAGSSVNGGVLVTSIDRLGDVFLEARVRQETSSAAFLDAVADAYALLESTIAEPGDKGLAAQLDTFFTSWQDVANRPDDDAARAVLLENANTLVARVASGYRAVEAQWQAARSQAAALATDVNSAADAVADLNARIKAITVSGASPNALIDQRNQVLTQLSGLVGAEARLREDGTVDVMVGGNALVRGEKANHIVVEGANTLRDLAVTPPARDKGQVRLLWADSKNDVGATGGRLPGLLSVLAPANANGTGGAIAELAGRLNSLVTNDQKTGLADVVNAQHLAGESRPGVGGTPFFGMTNGEPAALSLRVLITDVADIAAGLPGAGARDGSNADKLSQLANDVGALWSHAVVDLGVNTRTATQRAMSAEATRAVADGLLTSQAGVDLDEETVNLMAYQRAYEAAARVITSVDQILDTLINRTGVVGR
ncbi:flagellar hook-associated protein FlgK [Georgenia thermotolerans]|uniref:Flagellar hook-associated protein 1 n=1 Tax=Georgenia thermotolerans TaxID=527326 RepID=A0A7J5UPN5_9MICO|nr:flagellar hook-associated protein FlgK [Georgenia thermotolerans]KAE8764074.1 flagellar hook-associated protein FlgK [Georgenia thermotolerans]